jgi:hypothetical protein
VKNGAGFRHKYIAVKCITTEINVGSTVMYCFVLYFVKYIPYKNIIQIKRLCLSVLYDELYIL